MTAPTTALFALPVEASPREEVDRAVRILQQGRLVILDSEFSEALAGILALDLERGLEPSRDALRAARAVCVAAFRQEAGV